MSNVSSEMLLEHLKALRKEVSEVKQLRSEVRDGFASMREHMRSLSIVAHQQGQ